MTIVTVGIDLAKNVFAVHGVDASGKPTLVRPSVARDKLLELIASVPPCLIGMEACSGAHHWAREFQKLGHSVRLMAPKFVAPYRLSGRRGKNDAADAAAICEAVKRTFTGWAEVRYRRASHSLVSNKATARTRRINLMTQRQRLNPDVLKPGGVSFLTDVSSEVIVPKAVRSTCIGKQSGNTVLRLALGACLFSHGTNLKVFSQ